MATNPVRDRTLGLAIGGSMQPGYDTALTPAAMEFVIDLTRRFGARIASLLEARVARQRQLDNGALPDFLAETRSVREGQWIKHPNGKLDDGRKVTVELFRAITLEELDQLEDSLGAEAYASGNFERAAALLDKITTAPDFETFITLPAYREIH